MRKLAYNQNPHQIMMVIASAKKSEKTEEDIRYIAFGKTRQLVRSGMDALDRRGFLDRGVRYKVTRTGREYAQDTWKLSEAGERELILLARETPGRSSYNTDGVSDLGQSKTARELQREARARKKAAREAAQ